MGIPLDRVRLQHVAARLDRFLARRSVRVVIFLAVFLWVWLFLASRVASAGSCQRPAIGFQPDGLSGSCASLPPPQQGSRTDEEHAPVRNAAASQADR